MTYKAMAIDSIRLSVGNLQHVIILYERGTNRYLPIWIGPAEADAISTKLNNINVARPMTHDFAYSIINAFGGKVEFAVINKFENDCFYAKVIIKTFWRKMSIDCRPSDAIAIAVRAPAPIYADDQVLKKASIIIDLQKDNVLNSEKELPTIEQKETNELQNLSVRKQQIVKQNEKSSEMAQEQTNNLNRFSDAVRNIFIQAEEQARHLTSKHIDTGHLLLALISQAPNTATDILYALGINKADILSGLTCGLDSQEPPDLNKILLDDSAKEVIELSVKEAQYLACGHVEPEHLLIAMLRQQNGIAGRILDELGITIDRIYAELIIRHNKAKVQQ
ncbi:MAG: bifunctional nuclease domain-containing protein [Candidatus Bathyarchaeia archaeon]|jgi:bifunctional DNase/RNase